MTCNCIKGVTKETREETRCEHDQASLGAHIAVAVFVALCGIAVAVWVLFHIPIY